MLEKETVGDRRKKVTTMVTATAETEKLVTFVKKGEEASAPEWKHYGLTHMGRCTKQVNVQTKYDQSTPFV